MDIAECSTPLNASNVNLRTLSGQGLAGCWGLLTYASGLALSPLMMAVRSGRNASVSLYTPIMVTMTDLISNLVAFLSFLFGGNILPELTGTPLAQGHKNSWANAMRTKQAIEGLPDPHRSYQREYAPLNLKPAAFLLLVFVSLFTQSTELMIATVPLTALDAASFLEKERPALSLLASAATGVEHAFTEYPFIMDSADGKVKVDGYLFVAKGNLGGFNVEVRQILDSDAIPVDRIIFDGKRIPTTKVIVNGESFAIKSARVARAVAKLDIYQMNGSYHVQHTTPVSVVLEAGLTAAMYRQHLGYRLVLDLGVRPEDTKKATFMIGSPGESVKVFLVRRKSRVNQLPIAEEFGLTPIYLSKSVQRMDEIDMIDATCEALREEGRITVGHRDNVLFTTKSTSKAKGVYKAFGVLSGDYDVRYNAHTGRRLGVVLGRKSNISMTVCAPAGTLPDAMDGQNIISRAISGVLQGTVISSATGVVAAMKGLIRPPVVIDNCVEQEGHESTGEFNTSIEDGQCFTAFPFDRPQEESASLNQQIVSFSAEDQGLGYYTQLTGKLMKDGLDALLTPLEQAWHKLGFAMADVVNNRRIDDYARKFPISGFRGTVIGVGNTDGQPMMGENEVRLPARIANRLDLKVGDKVRIARDPGQPDGKSVQELIYAGTFSYRVSDEEIDAQDTIAISCFSEAWKEMGGDFDGDAALVWPARKGYIGKLFSGDVDTDSLRKESSLRKKALFGGFTRQELVKLFLKTFGASFSIGAEVNRARRMWLAGKLSDEARALAQSLAQGTIDLKKHEVDLETLAELQRMLAGQLEELGFFAEENAIPDLISALGDLKRATAGNDGTLECVWDETLAVAENAFEDERIGKAGTAFAEYIIVLGDLNRKLRSMEKSGDVPEDLVEAAKDSLIDKVVEGAPKQERQARFLYHRWCRATSLKQEAMEAGDEMKAESYKAEAEHIMTRTRTLIHRGELLPEAILIKTSAFFATHVLQPRDIELLTKQDEDEVEAEEFELSF